jgi:glycosyltransferase involved in cell wall biosynthesis
MRPRSRERCSADGGINVPRLGYGTITGCCGWFLGAEHGVAVRVGLIAPPWLPVPPTKYGGTEAVVDRLARGLHARGHDVLLFATGDSTCPVPTAWAYAESQRARLGNVAVELRHVIAAYDELVGFDVVHDHSLAGPMYAQRFPELLTVATAHAPLDGELGEVFRTISATVPIIAISHHQASMAGLTEVAAVIHHGIEPEAFPVGNGDGGYYCWLGRMASYKGAREAIEIAKRAGVTLLLAGKIEHEDEVSYFHEQVEPLLGDDVRYIGEIGGDDRAAFLGGAVALLNPITWSEPFGLSMIESLACGTPVLAFPSGSAPEILDDGLTGLLCADVDDMVARLPEVGWLDRAACRKAVESRFSTDRMVEEHVALYERLLSARREGRTPAVGQF